MSKGFMYILKCCDGSYYTGSTTNLELRLAQHQCGEGANHTSKRLPVELVYCEEYERIDDAFYREKQVQGWGRKKKESLIAKTFENLHELAKCKNKSHSENAGFDSAQPAGCSAQPAGCSAQPAGCSAQPAGCSAQPAGCSAQPAGCSAQPADNSAPEPDCSLSGVEGKMQTSDKKEYL
jgi:putative endonuclease